MYYGRNESFHYAECGNCGLVYQLLPPNDLGSYYPDNYHCHHVPSKKFNPKSIVLRIRDRAVVRGKKNILSDFIDQKRPAPAILKTFSHTNPSFSDQILDIGCGSGEFLFQLEDIGFKNLTGVDPFLPDDVHTISSNISFRKTSLFHLKGIFDIITLNHSFEHMVEPDLVLEKLNKLLSPKGRIMIRIPIAGSAAWEQYKENWYQLDAPRHLFLYSINSLNILAQRCGFKITSTVFDSTITQFTRSQLYKQGITSIDFLNKYEGKLDKFFSEEQLRAWALETIKVNQSETGDQAAFILTKSK
jgi:SAM-dependent methyltransferase